MAKIDDPKPKCPKCHDHRHYRTEKGWARCDCFWDSLALTGFIKPPLRTPTDGLLPKEYHQLPRYWGLEDVMVEGGSFDEFRFTAWRSLLELYDYGISYLTINGTRCVDILFERDSNEEEYPSLQSLADWQLVVMIVGVHDITTNPMYGPAVWRALQVRKFDGKPTWVYAKYGFPKPNADWPVPPQRVWIGNETPTTPGLGRASRKVEPLGLPPVSATPEEKAAYKRELDLQAAGMSLMDSAKRLFTKKPNGGAL